MQCCLYANCEANNKIYGHNNQINVGYDWRSNAPNTIPIQKSIGKN